MDMKVIYINGTEETFEWVEEMRIEKGFLIFKAGAFGNEVGIPVSQIKKYETE